MHSPNKSPSNTVSKENDQLDISPSEWIHLRSDNNNNSDLIIKKIIRNDPDPLLSSENHLIEIVEFSKGVDVEDISKKSFSG